jgi:hypothetical protein
VIFGRFAQEHTRFFPRQPGRNGRSASPAGGAGTGAGGPLSAHSADGQPAAPEENSFINLRDDELVRRWSENVVWPFFSGMAYDEPRLPCETTQIGRFRTAIGEEGLEPLLTFTIHTTVTIKAIKPAEPERVIVDSTVQEMVVAHPVDSRWL